MIHHPPAFCTQHGLFPATQFGLEDVVEGTLVGCKVSCPKCGRLSEIIPGRYDAIGRQLSILIDPSISQEALAAIRELVGKVERKELTPEQAAAEAKKISPTLAGLFDPATWSPEVKAAIIGVVGLLLAQSSSCSVNINYSPTTIERIERAHPQPPLAPDSILKMPPKGDRTI